MNNVYILLGLEAANSQTTKLAFGGTLNYINNLPQGNDHLTTLKSTKHLDTNLFQQ